MRIKKLLLLVSHLTALGVGFALDVYFLPVLIAPPAPTAAEVAAQSGDAGFKGRFRRDLKDSDAPSRYNTVVVWCETFG